MFSRLNTDDGHEWVDGTAMDFKYWRQGEPNDALGQESCVSISAGDG